nr:MAG TPA: hypothetical protein [Caudoviricetes sp.]
MNDNKGSILSFLTDYDSSQNYYIILIKILPLFI